MKEMNSPTASCCATLLARVGGGPGATRAALQRRGESDSEFMPQRGERIRDVTLGSHRQSRAVCNFGESQPLRRARLEAF